MNKHIVIERLDGVYGKLKRVISKSGKDRAEAIIDLGGGNLVTRHIHQFGGDWWAAIIRNDNLIIVQRVVS